MTAQILLALTVFGACCVESIEATVITLAAMTKGRTPALFGATSALGVLCVAVGLVGVPLVHFVPLNALRLILGGLALYLGATWLRKAILRASGRKAIHTEDQRYSETLDAKGSAFGVAFGGVLVEGFEVCLIVLTLGASSHHLGLAASAAGVAIAFVLLVALLIAPKLRTVPENTLKLFVGVMLTSFGVFWLGEGAGIAWPGADLMVLALIATFAGASRFAITQLERLPS